MSNIKSYLEENQIPAKRTPEGLYIDLTETASGVFPKKGDYVKVHYTGTLLDGNKFDSSVDRGEPFTFQLGAGQVIQGWDIGIGMIPVGGKGTLYIPHMLGYGEHGAGGGVIPAFASLVFEVEVIETLTEEAHLSQQALAEAERRKALLKMLSEQLGKDKEIIDAYVKEKGLSTTTSPTGLQYTIETQGDGARAQAGKTVEVHYTGRLLDGTKFDSSHDRNQPISFELGAGRVIPGWDEGIALFNEGGKGTLLIPSPLGYGPRAMGPIPANAVLRFEIELLSVS